jgi:acetone carboxylase gamma subunit
MESSINEYTSISSNNTTNSNNNYNIIFEKPKLLRNYTIICDKDYKNINEGKCPDYAIRWGLEANTPHWPKGHNFIKGNKK